MMRSISAAGHVGSLARPPLDYPSRPFHHFLHDTADRHPERVALRSLGRMVTYRELDGLANAYANALIEDGVRPGDRVALIVPNGIEWAIAMLGSSQVGAAVALLNPRWHVNEIRHAVDIVQPSVVVADEDGATAIDTIGVDAKRISAGATLPGWALLDDIVLSGDGGRPEPVVEVWDDLDVRAPSSVPVRRAFPRRYDTPIGHWWRPRFSGRRQAALEKMTGRYCSSLSSTSTARLPSLRR